MTTFTWREVEMLWIMQDCGRYPLFHEPETIGDLKIYHCDVRLPFAQEIKELIEHSALNDAIFQIPHNHKIAMPPIADDLYRRVFEVGESGEKWNHRQNAFTLQRKADREQFVRDHKQLIEAVKRFSNMYRKMISHKTPNGELLVRLARQKLGYSPFTWDFDILISLFIAYKKTFEDKKLK